MGTGQKIAALIDADGKNMKIAAFSRIGIWLVKQAQASLTEITTIS
jgi:hypothetical protein